jgi:hypothetical protein
MFNEVFVIEFNIIAVGNVTTLYSLQILSAIEPGTSMMVRLRQPEPFAYNITLISFTYGG